MSDDLVKQLREDQPVTQDMVSTAQCALQDAAADRIEQLAATNEELEAKLAKAVEALAVINALDPEGLVNGCSQSALIGLVLRMGEVARATLTQLKGQDDKSCPAPTAAP